MSKKSLPHPTGAELELLRVLWERGPSTVREIHEVLSGEKETGYTTTLKILQKMTEKGLVRRDDSVRPQVYRAAKSRKRTQLRMLDDLTQRAFRGSAMRLVMQMVSAGRLSDEELAEIQRLIETAKGEKQ